MRGGNMGTVAARELCPGECVCTFVCYEDARSINWTQDFALARSFARTHARTHADAHQANSVPWCM